MFNYLVAITALFIAFYTVGSVTNNPRVGRSSAEIPTYTINVNPK